MTKYEESGFLLGCLMGFDMESDQVEAMLKERNLIIENSSLIDCQLALREQVGEERWKNGVRAIQAHTRESSAKSN